MSSANASQLAGLRDRGRLAVGYRADLVILDELLAVAAVMHGGRFVTHALPTIPQEPERD